MDGECKERRVQLKSGKIKNTNGDNSESSLSRQKQSSLTNKAQFILFCEISCVFGPFLVYVSGYQEQNFPRLI